MNFTSDELGQLTQDICETMLGLELTPRGDELGCHPVLVASVSISGTWQAAIEVAVCDAAASSIAAAMFGSETTTPEEVADAVAEVANMIGGNIKGRAGGECQLSLPSVSPSLMPNDELASTGFALGGGNVHVFLKKSTRQKSDQCIGC